MIVIVRALAVFAVLLLPALARAVPLEQYDTTGGKDWAQAFDAALRACAGRPCTIELGPTAYPLARTVEVCTAVRIVGTGVGSAQAASAIRTTRTTAFRTWHRGQCPLPGYGLALGALTLEHLIVQNTGGRWREGDKPFYGVDQGASVQIRDVWIDSFVQGVRADCDAAAQKKLCGGSTYENTLVTLSEHSGFSFSGGDSSVHVLSRVSSNSNCRAPEPWKAAAIAGICAKTPKHAICSTARLQCGGFFDLSMYGNTYIATMAHEENGHAGYVLVGARNASACVGCYAEVNTSPQFVDTLGDVFGGANVFDGPGWRINGPTTPGITIANGDVLFRLGYTAGTGVVWSLSNPAIEAHPWRYKLKENGDMYLDVGNLLPWRGFLPWRVTP